MKVRSVLARHQKSRIVCTIECVGASFFCLSLSSSSWMDFT